MPKRAKFCLEDNVTPLSLNNLNLEDVILGDRSNNEMTGTDANDIFLSSRGSDIMKGGDGIDIVDYSAHRGAITIGPAGAIDKGRGESDLLRDIEVIIGAEDRPNRIDVSSVGEASSAYLDVDLSTGELSAKDIPFIGNLSFSIEHFQLKLYVKSNIYMFKIGFDDRKLQSRETLGYYRLLYRAPLRGLAVTMVVKVSVSGN